MWAPSVSNLSLLLSLGIFTKNYWVVGRLDLGSGPEPFEITNLEVCEFDAFSNSSLSGGLKIQKEKKRSNLMRFPYSFDLLPGRSEDRSKLIPVEMMWLNAIIEVDNPRPKLGRQLSGHLSCAVSAWLVAIKGDKYALAASLQQSFDLRI
jgi:hypothetical protein